MTNVTAFGAVKEIGGNKLLLEDKGTKVFLDFGLCFSRMNSFFSPYLRPRSWEYIKDFIALGLLPDLEGLYRQDYESRMRESSEDPLYDGVILSHPHLDHAGFISYLRSDIPIFCSQGSKAILQTFEESSFGFHEYTRLKENFKLRPSKRDSSKLTKDKGSIIPRDINIFKPDFKVDDIIVHSFPVDHSVPGAHSFVIETSEGAIVYTGDIRFHGRRSNYSDFFVSKAAEYDPILLLTEGTRISESTTYGELDLQRDLFKLSSDVEGLILTNFPIRDTDRMRSFIEVAEAVDRTLVISLRQAYALKTLEENGVKDIPRINEVSIFIPKKGWGVLGNNNYPNDIQLQDYSTWEREFLDYTNSVRAEEIVANPRKYIFRCDFFELKHLFDIKPPEKSVYIRSVTEPIDEEMELDQRRVNEWLKYFNLYPYHQLHCSGHASSGDIKEMINRINPKQVMPIHTEEPLAFSSFHSNILNPELGEKYEIK